MGRSKENEGEEEGGERRKVVEGGRERGRGGKRDFGMRLS